MPKIKYRDINFKADTLKVILKANEIIAEYAAQGFTLTLRQLYYQFVARALIPNRDNEYDKLGSIINDARLAGLIDWNHIEDRTRHLRDRAKWKSPASIVDACAAQYHIDLWKTQNYRPEVWIEKDALVGVIEGVCHELDVPHFSCRGYTSQTGMWDAGQRLLAAADEGKIPIIFHFGDHDPSGIDMSRDIQARLEIFTRDEVTFERLALNMDQVNTYNPPPNPTKLSDSRAKAYLADFGHESWELDALEPSVIAGLVRTSIEALLDTGKWQDALDVRAEGRDVLSGIADNWDDVQTFVKTIE